MKHSYFQRLLIAAMALFGVITQSSATTVIKAVDSSGKGIPGLTLRVEYLYMVVEYDDEGDEIDAYEVEATSIVQLDTNGEYKFDKDIDIERIDINFEGTYISVYSRASGGGGISGGIITLYKLRLNSSENRTVECCQNPDGWEESTEFTIQTNKDYYLPAYFEYEIDGNEIYLDSDMTITQKFTVIKAIDSAGVGIPNLKLTVELYDDGYEEIDIQLDSNGEYKFDKNVIIDRMYVNVGGANLRVSSHSGGTTRIKKKVNDNEFADYWTIQLLKLRLNSSKTRTVECRYIDDYEDFTLETNKDYYLPLGDYNIEEQRVRLESDLTLDLNNKWTLTVNVVDTDGKTDTGDDLEVYVKSTDGFSNYYTLKKGKVTIGLKEGTYTIRVNNYDSKTIEVKEDMTITLKVPKIISFDVTIDGKQIVEWAKEFGRDDQDYSTFKLYTIDYKSVSSWNSEGKYYARLDPEQPYRLRCGYFEHRNSDDDFVKGTTKITDGSTIRIGTFNVEADGNGLVFPRDEFSGSGSYKLFVGNPIRLAAIPVGNAEFVSWTINGKEYTEPLIDFTVKDDINTATAKFSGEIVNYIKAAESSIGQINVRIEGNYLILPSELEGAACIYATDGRLVKRTGVVGDHLSIGDLPSGAYVLALTANGQRWNAEFVKP